MRGVRQRGGALVLVLIGVVLAATLVGLATTSSVAASRSAGDDQQVMGAWYTAHAGVWAAADRIQAGGTGDVDGDVDAATIAASAAADGDADGFADFSPVATLLARGDGAFEARARDEGGGRRRVRARGVSGGVHRTVEGLFETQQKGPFRWAAFGASGLSLLGNEASDSWDSDVAAWGVTPITTTSGGRSIRGQSGGVATDGNAAVTGTASVYGDADAVGVVTVAGSGQVTGTVGVLSPPLAPAAPTWAVPGPGDPDVQNSSIGVAYGAPLTRAAGTLTLPPGKYVFSTLTLSGSARLLVDTSAGDVEIYLTQPGTTSMHLSVNAQLQPTDPSKAVGGNVLVYSKGGVLVDGTAKVNVTGTFATPVPGDPIKVQVYSDVVPSGVLPEVRISSSARTSSVIYAPQARLRYGSNVEVWGAAVTGSVYSSGNAFLHYDEALRAFVPGGAVVSQTQLVPVMIRELR